MSAGNRVTIFGEECTSQWVQSNLPVPGPGAIICDSSKEKIRQICKFKAIADMELPATLFSSCGGPVCGLSSLPTASVWQ